MLTLTAAASDVFAGRAHVVLHVAAAQHAARVDIFKSGENFLRRTPRHVDNHIQPAAMAHAHHQLHGSALAGGFDHFVHQRNQRGHAFQRKPLAAQIALLQHLLKKSARIS